MNTVTIRIHRIQSTTITVSDDFDPDRDLDGQLEREGAWAHLDARSHQDTRILDVSAVPEPLPIHAGEPYVLVEGGLVQNNPLLPVFDLDVLETDFITVHDVDYAEELADRARAHGLRDIATELDRFVAEHADLRDEPGSDA